MNKSFLTILFLIFLVYFGCTEQISEKPTESHTSIGFVGCSNTRQTVQGYNLVGGKAIWVVDERNIHEYDGGAVRNWAEKENKFWKIFDNYLKNNPNTSAIWWQLCIRKEEAAMTYEDALPVLEILRKKIPGVIIYVSPLAEYTENVCELTGTEGIKRAKSLAQELDSRNEDVRAGPFVGPLRLADISNQEDHCHPHKEGAMKMGRQLKAFFDTPGEEVGKQAPQERAYQGENNLERAGKEAFEEGTIKNIEKEAPDNSLPLEESILRTRIEAALAPGACPDIPKEVYPSSYYQGPLTDTHLHIPAIPDWSLEDEERAYKVAPQGRFGGPQALLGWNIKMNDIACTITHEGTHKNFAFFPVYEEIPAELLEIWNRTMEKYPDQFTPFIMAPGNDNEPDGFPTVDAETLQEMLLVYPNLFRGYGEIGLYARENGGSAELPPDAKRLQEIYPVVQKNNLVVYFHLGEGHKDSFETVLKQNPNINFIWHGDQLSADEIEEILYAHPNAYYGIDAFFGHDYDTFRLYVGDSKEAYINKVNANFDTIVAYALDDWKEIIKRHPDQVLWGSDRGDAVWNYDPDVGKLQVKLARAFIGKLDPLFQEKFAYRNAEQLVSNN